MPLQNTLCVILRGNGQVLRGLDSAKDRYLAFLRSHNINDVHVGIRDVDLNFNASLFAIPPNNPIVTIHGNAKHEVVEFYARIYLPATSFLCLAGRLNGEDNDRLICCHSWPMTSAS